MLYVDFKLNIYAYSLRKLKLQKRFACILNTLTEHLV